MDQSGSCNGGALSHSTDPGDGASCGELMAAPAKAGYVRGQPDSAWS